MKRTHAPPKNPKTNQIKKPSLFSFFFFFKYTMLFSSLHFLGLYMGCTPIQKQTRLNLVWSVPLQYTTMEFHKSFSFIYKVTVNYFQGICKEKTMLPDWPFPTIRFVDSHSLWKCLSSVCHACTTQSVTQQNPLWSSKAWHLRKNK